ncbi:MAG: hypothetical protein ABIJ56_18680 [Pseudomonadota bacterium]
MSISRVFKRLWYGPPLVTNADELVKGTVIIEGTVGDSKESLVSPLTKSNCIAFKYRATYRTPSRTQGVVERLLKDVEVYSPEFQMSLDGGSIKVVPTAQGEFDAAQHQELQSGGFAGFKAEEFLIRRGTKVRARGKLSRGEADGFVLRLQEMEILEQFSSAAGLKRRSRPKQKQLKKMQKKKKKG